MKKLKFTNKELEALDNAINYLDDSISTHLVSLRVKCVSLNHKNTSISGLKRLIDARDTIKNSMNGITCDELGNILGVSIATVYRMSKKLVILDGNIHQANRWFFYKSKHDKAIKQFNESIFAIEYGKFENRLLTLLKNNPYGVKLTKLEQVFGVSNVWLRSKINILKGKGVNFKFGTFFLTEIPNDDLIPKYHRIINHVLDVGTPQKLSDLKTKFKISYFPIKKLKDFELIISNQFIGKKEWFS